MKNKSPSEKLPPLKEFLIKGYRYELGKGYIDIDFRGNWIGERIREYQEAFSDNLLVYEFSSFKKRPLETLKIIEDFLGVEEYFTTDNFDNRRINESSRRNNTLISHLLSRQSFIELVGRLIPRAVIMKGRYLFDKFSAKNSGEKSKRASHSEEELKVAQQILSEQRVNVSNIFKESSILRGYSSYHIENNSDA